MIIAVDFDGTIVEHEFPRIGKPVPGAFKWLKRFAAVGATLILWTMRSDGQESGDVLTEAVRYCEENGVEFWGVNANPLQHAWTTSTKAYAHLYIDDAAFGCPLRHPRRIDGSGDIVQTRRPFVDWRVVGPAVLKSIKAEMKEFKLRKAAR